MGDMGIKCICKNRKPKKEKLKNQKKLFEVQEYGAK